MTDLAADLAASLAYRTRSEVAREARDSRAREWFETRRWRVIAEFSGERRKRLRGRPGEPVQMGVVIYDHGEFWITSEHGVFQTPFGYKGRHGFLIAELDPGTGEDLQPPHVVAFGYKLLGRMQELYQCFPAGLPPERRHPPRLA